MAPARRPVGAAVKDALLDHIRRVAKLVPHPMRQRIKALGLRVAATYRAGAVPPAALVESGTTLDMDCLLCGERGSAHWIIGHVSPTRAGAFSSRDQRLVQCSVCEAIYLLPKPSPADITLLYKGSEQFTESCYTGPAQVARTLDNYRRRLQEHGLFPASGEALLEVGAGLAWLSRVCKTQDPGIVTVAQDLSGECVAQCPWVDRYHVGPLESMQPGTLFRLISMTHVIEHLLDPADMLAELAARLCEGGRIFITAPYRPPLWKRADGIGPWLTYSYLHVPAHVSYLSKRWFETACRDHGLRLLRWDPSHDGHQAFEVVLEKYATERGGRR